MNVQKGNEHFPECCDFLCPVCNGGIEDMTPDYDIIDNETGYVECPHCAAALAVTVNVVYKYRPKVFTNKR